MTSISSATPERQTSVISFVFPSTSLSVSPSYGRDMREWDLLRSVFHPDATVHVSWFNGPAAEFVQRSSELAKHMNQMAVVRSMSTREADHNRGRWVEPIEEQAHRRRDGIDGA